MDEAEGGPIQRVEAREDAAKLLECVDAAFDEMTLAVEPGSVRALHLGRLVRWDHRLTALGMLATWLIAPQLLTRAPEILAITTREN